jgi:hypothetical protein
MNNWRKILSWKPIVEDGMPHVGEIWCWKKDPSPMFDLRILDVYEHTVKYRAVRYHKTGESLAERFTIPVTIDLDTFLEENHRIEDAPLGTLSWKALVTDINVGEMWGKLSDSFSVCILYVGSANNIPDDLLIKDMYPNSPQEERTMPQDKTVVVFRNAANSRHTIFWNSFDHFKKLGYVKKS